MLVGCSGVQGPWCLWGVAGCRVLSASLENRASVFMIHDGDF